MRGGNIYLAGFMGTGKSTVGRLLARRLKRRFVDLDSVVERDAAMSVARIFAARGEKAFRTLERRALARVSRQNRCVVALGGGALLSAESRRRVAASGTLVHLRCPEAELWRRLKGGAGKRPLLGGERPRETMRRLLRKRRALARGGITVAAGGRSPGRTAAVIARRLGT